MDFPSPGGHGRHRVGAGSSQSGAPGVVPAHLVARVPQQRQGDRSPDRVAAGQQFLRGDDEIAAQPRLVQLLERLLGEFEDLGLKLNRSRRFEEVSPELSSPTEVYSRATPRPAKPLVRQHLRTAMNEPQGWGVIKVR